MKHRKLWFWLYVLILALVLFGVIKGREAGAPKTPTTGVSQNSTQVQAQTPSNKAEPATFDKKQHSTTDPASPWVIANKKHPLRPVEYTPPDLVSTGNGQLMRLAAARALNRMLADARTAGHTVTPASGYRSYNTQVSVYNNEVKRYGKAVADSQSARPGYSEHQTGWAIDLASGGCSITDCFGDTPGGKWVTANAYKYGFILRYTPDKVAVTGYRGETWHFRYVGAALAGELRKQHVKTLEEFFGVSGGNYN